VQLGVPVPLQGVHAPPVLPQSKFELPRTQLPAAVQHPPRHGCVASHVVTHTLAAEQEVCETQSATELHPQDPPPLAARHRLPVPLEGHLTHVVPPLPHANCEVPWTHEPPEQHPPLQGCAAEHEAAQTPASEQALFDGQSAAV
jgi:hypothetical protein